jgi:hypothetical protein
MKTFVQSGDLLFYQVKHTYDKRRLIKDRNSTIRDGPDLERNSCRVFIDYSGIG